MPICPECEQPMSPLQVVSLAGVQNKVVSWRCDAHDVEAGLAHPVQLAHLHVGDGSSARQKNPFRAGDHWRRARGVSADT